MVSGVIDNLSQSGLFIHSDNAPAKGELLEMFFEMPIEISGQQNAEVLCAGQVVRVAGAENEDGSRGFAVKVIDYRFLNNEARKRRRENNSQRGFPAS